MIPFDFDYYKPTTIEEAVRLYKELDNNDKDPLYYGGGTEIITMARMNTIYTQAVIDLKGIPECNTLEFQNDYLVIGAGVTLTRIAESKLFPLLGKAVGRIADHTTQGKITLGGNIAGTILYREAVLPLLLSDSKVLIAGENGQRTVPFAEVFQERLRLAKSEFLVRIIIDKRYTTAPFIHVKRTRSEKIDYPLVSVTALTYEDQIRIAFSGVCAFPFRSHEVESGLNNDELPYCDRINFALECLPAPFMNDISGSAKYREFILRQTLLNILEKPPKENPND